ncbi:hypothetical protein [Microbacterium sp. NPDC078849]|uniref:hypothetical protein n=1 Tax=unclassified Microbacterium TaxID=2609290 RepID=UPI003450A082
MNESPNNWPNAAQLSKDVADAKRAPEIAAWLRLGPLPIPEIIGFRRERMIESGMIDYQADWYSTASVMHDLGRIAGVGGPVEYRDGLLWLNESHRDLIDAWVREDAFRQFSIAPDDLDES